MSLSSSISFFDRPSHRVAVVEETDVIVCGAGPAGFSAAIAAARSGAKVRLIEAQGCIGGVWTAGLLTWILDCENKRGVMTELLARLEQASGAEPMRSGGRGFDPEIAKVVLEQMCLESGVKVRLHTRIASAHVDAARRLRTIVTESKSGAEAWRAKVFIDATGDGDLAALAGCGFDLGHPQTGRMQPMSMLCILAGYGDLTQFPFSITNWHENKDWLRREIERGGHTPSYAKPTMFLAAPGLTFLMANHEYGVSGLDAQQLTDATLRSRAEVHHIVNALRTQGGRWKDLRIVATSSQIGVREGRRIHGLYQLTEDDLVRGARFDDGICRVTFPIDVHSTDPSKNKGIEGAKQPAKPYDVPLRSLIARDVAGLMMAGRCISGDFIAHSSYRVTGNAVAMGEAAGICAAEASARNCLPNEVPWSAIRERVAPL